MKIVILILLLLPVPLQRPGLFNHVTLTSANMAAASDNSDNSDNSVRKRRVDSSKTETRCTDISKEHGTKISKDTEKKETTVESLQTGTYWLTRIVLLRAVAFIYCKHVDFFC